MVVLAAVMWRLASLRLDRPELRALEPLGRLVPWVPRLLGIHLGVALLALAATGSFLTSAVTLDALDVFGLVGLVVAPATFVVVAGAVELLFGQVELVGHLPVYGVFLALLAYGSNPDTFALVRWLPPVARTRSRAAAVPA